MGAVGTEPRGPTEWSHNGDCDSLRWPSSFSSKARGPERWGAHGGVSHGAAQLTAEENSPPALSSLYLLQREILRPAERALQDTWDGVSFYPVLFSRDSLPEASVSPSLKCTSQAELSLDAG